MFLAKVVCETLGSLRRLNREYSVSSPSVSSLIFFWDSGDSFAISSSKVLIVYFLAVRGNFRTLSPRRGSLFNQEFLIGVMPNLEQGSGVLGEIQTAFLYMLNT